MEMENLPLPYWELIRAESRRVRAMVDATKAKYLAFLEASAQGAAVAAETSQAGNGGGGPGVRLAMGEQLPFEEILKQRTAEALRAALEGRALRAVMAAEASERGEALHASPRTGSSIGSEHSQAIREIAVGLAQRMFPDRFHAIRERIGPCVDSMAEYAPQASNAGPLICRHCDSVHSRPDDSICRRRRQQSHSG